MAWRPDVLQRPLPTQIETLDALTMDLRWTWSHASDKLWEAMDPEVWELTHNPWLILQSVSQARLEQLAADSQFTTELQRLAQEHQDHLQQRGWFNRRYPDQPLNPIAYFSMEFGLGEALPLHAGGLGILAGDYLKTACDLNVPLVGVGLLYQEGYCRQFLDDYGWQVEAYPYNDPRSLPIRPVMMASGEWLWCRWSCPAACCGCVSGRCGWAEAYRPEVGWAPGDGQEHHDPGWDAAEAAQLYDLLEQSIVPELYDRDLQGISARWVGRIRTAMAQLAPNFSSNRMLREYVEHIYLPATARFRERAAEEGRLARELVAWHTVLEQCWPRLHFGTVQIQQEDEHWRFQVQVYLGEVDPAWVRVELYANPWEGQDGVCESMGQGEPLPGAVHGYLYRGSVPATRPAEHFTPRIIPMHPAACVPLEASQILWQR